MEGERYIDRVRREETERAALEIDLSDVTPENLIRWTSPENLQDKKHKNFHGFELIYGIDGNTRENRQVTLVRMTGPYHEPPHFHADANSFLIFVAGEGIIMDQVDGKMRQSRRGVGHRAFVPKGRVHGFSLEVGETLDVVSIQTPPIQDQETGEEDYVVV